MRLRTLIVVFFGSIALCTPVPQLTGENKVQASQSSFLPGVKAGFVATFSLAGLAALAVGITEYATRLHNRLKQTQIENQNLLYEANFNRSRTLSDVEFRHAGTDVVLDLVEKFANGKKGEHEMDGHSEELKESVVMAEDKTAVDELVVESSEDLPPLPRLPGFPPLSPPAAR